MTTTINNTAYYVVKVDGVIVCVTENDSVACDYLVDYPGRVSVDPVEQGKFYGEDWSVKAGWEVQTLPQSLPFREMGTLQQEIPVALTNYESVALITIFIVGVVIGYVTDWVR